jgi:hypothetical protein
VVGLLAVWPAAGDTLLPGKPSPAGADVATVQQLAGQATIQTSAWHGARGKDAGGMAAKRADSVRKDAPSASRGKECLP